MVFGLFTCVSLIIVVLVFARPTWGKRDYPHAEHYKTRGQLIWACVAAFVPVINIFASIYLLLRDGRFKTLGSFFNKPLHRDRYENERYD